jgi:D-3-phosphoglycerate dehydrogenase
MKILVCDGVSEQGVEILSKEFEVDVKKKLAPEELLAIIPEYDALVVRSETKVTKAVLAVAEKLKAIGRAGVGVDNIDVEAATQKGVIVLNAPEGNTIAATEHTVAMMLALARNIPDAHGSMKNREWKRSKYMGVEMRGKTLGVIGLGRIGSGVAKRAIAMEMNVIGYDPYINADHAKNLGIELAEVAEIFAKADFITFHMPLTPQTKYMVNKEAFAKMKPGVRLINCARGGIIDELALAEALQSGIVAGAAIDVFEKEPVDPENPLLGLDNIVLTPHLGASTAEAQVGVAVDVAHGIIAALRGEPVTTAVNMAPVAPHVLKLIRPYFNLAERMGCTAVNLADGPIASVDVEYNGDITEVDTKMLTTAVLKGLLNPILQEAVNYVNAPGLAKTRNIKVKEVKNKEAANFANLLTVRITTAKGQHLVQGTLFGEEERIVNIDGHRVDVDPRARVLICPHINRPGIIGKVGTLMGEHGINISGMQVGKTEVSGTNIMVLAVDNDIPADILAKVTAIDGIFGAKLINFNAI